MTGHELPGMENPPAAVLDNGTSVSSPEGSRFGGHGLDEVTPEGASLNKVVTSPVPDAGLPRPSTASGLMHTVLDALPTTDPVGAIAAALHRHDQVLQRVLADLARRDGLTDAQARVRYGLPLEEDA